MENKEIYSAPKSIVIEFVPSAIMVGSTEPNNRSFNTTDFGTENGDW